MTDWLPGRRERTRRMEALERDVEQLRARALADGKRLDGASVELAAQSRGLADVREALAATAAANAAYAAALSLATTELERLREAAKVTVEIEDRLATLEDLAGPEAVRAAEDRADADRKQFASMQTALKRVERQLELYAEEGRRTGVALLERLEGMRTEAAGDER